MGIGKTPCSGPEGLLSLVTGKNGERDWSRVTF